MIGTDLTTFITGLNGDATIDPTLLSILCQSAQAIIEEERSWMCLRKVDTSLSLTTANTWQTAKSIAGITDFSRFYGDALITLFDSSTNRRHYYRQVPFDRFLEYKDDNSAFWYDANGKTIYFGGTPPFAGTLYAPYMATSTLIDPTSASTIWSTFPARFAPLIGFYAVGIYKGAVDYDDVTKMMLPENRATLLVLKNALEKWDNEQQASEIQHNDPDNLYSYPRSGAVDRGDI